MSLKIINLFLILFILVTLSTLVRWQAPRPESIELLLYDIKNSDSGYHNYPLITNGRPGEADFLFIEKNNSKARIGYACWGMQPIYADYFNIPENGVLKLNLEIPQLSHTKQTDYTNGYYLIQSPDQFVDFASPYSGGRLIVKLNNSKIVYDKTVLWHLLRERFFNIGKNNLLPSITSANLANGFRFSVVNNHTDQKYSDYFKDYDYKLAYIIMICILITLVYNRYWAKLAKSFNVNSFKENFSAIIIIAMCFLGFLSFITFNKFTLFDSEWYSDYYDYLAQSLLHGHLNVPYGAIGGEAFIYKGNFYGYFGCFPAILRIPFILLNYHFGQLTRLSMLSAYLICLVFGLKIFRRLRREQNIPKSKTDYTESLMLINLGIGSSIFFLSSRTIIYHEAILWGVTLAFGSFYYALTYYKTHLFNHFTTALVLSTAALHSRPTTGILAFSLLFLIVLESCLQLRLNKLSFKLDRVKLHLLALGVVSFSTIFAVSYAKFESFNISPFQYHIQYTPDRIARFNNQSFSLLNLEHNVDVYVTGTYFKLNSDFPYFHQLPAYKYKSYPNAKIDSTETTISLPLCMSYFAALTMVCILSLFFYNTHSIKLSCIALLAGIPMVLLLFTAIYISHRYTADFVPYLYILGCFGILYILKSNKYSKLIYTALTILTLSSIFITLSYTIYFQRAEMWGVPNIYRTEYIGWRTTIDSFVKNILR